MSNTSSSKDSVIGKGRELVKPVVHGIARRALPVVERASGTKYVRERNEASAKKTPKAASSAQKIANETARSYRRLASLVKGRTNPSTDGWKVAPKKNEVDTKLRELARLNAHSVMVDTLIRGTSSGSSMLEAGRDLIDSGLFQETISLGLYLRRLPEHEQVGRAMLGMAYRHSSDPDVAWAEFDQLTDRTLIASIADDYYPTAIDTLGDEALPLLDQVVETEEIENWSSKAVLRTAESAFCIDAFEHVRTLIDSRLAWDTAEVGEAVRYELNRMLEWLPGGRHLERLPTTAGVRNFGILSYDQPGVRSRNIGDYIQTVASVGHLLRYENLRLTGDKGLTDYLTKLSRSVKPERRYSGPEAELNLVEVYRDGNVYQDIPEDTWYIAFGWYMHDIFGKSFNIPFHPNLRPILLSVFVRYPEMLTPEAIAYLKKYGPVGCRDWQSVALLRAVGVPAFFSGCLTTTVDTLFPAAERDNRSGTLRVDWMKDGKGPSKKQTVTAIRDKSFPENLELARNWVADYAYKYARVLTSRLHANLPARSVGADVEFEPKNKSDSRFGGLYGINSDEFNSIRNGILDKLAVMIKLIASGASEDEVYSKWVEITSDDIAAADEYLASEHLPDADSAAISAIVNEFELPLPESGVTDIVMTVEKGEEGLVPKAVEAIDGHSSTRYRVWLPSDALDTTQIDELQSSLSNGTVHLLPSVAFGDISNSNDLVQALLPVLFPNHERMIVLPAPVEVSTDIAELANTELGSALLGAKRDVRKNRSHGLTLMRRIASSFKDDYVGALKFIFASHAGMSEDFAPFDPQIAVFNVRELRRQGIVERVVGLMDSVGLKYVDALQIAVGGRYVAIGDDLNVRAELETSSTPKIVNWRRQTRHFGHMAVDK